MSELKNFGDVVCDYLHKSKIKDRNIQYCMQQTELHKVIEIAACAVDENNKIHEHQRRVGKIKLQEFANLLKQKEQEIKKVKKFDELLNIIKSIKCYRIGELVRYDTAERIGFFLKIYPEKIYLHAGVKVGVKNLLGNLYRKNFLIIDDLPYELKKYKSEFNLQFYDFESIFCQYKDKFEQLHFRKSNP